MKYSDEQFDALLVRALESAAQREAVELQASPPITQSSQSERRIEALLKKAEKQKKQPSKPLHRSIMRQVAAIFIAVILLAGTIYIIPDARAFVTGLLHTWFPDHFEYEITGEMPHAKPEDMVIGYVPEGFTLTSELVLDGVLAYYTFENQEGDYVQIDIVTSSTRAHVDNEHNTFYQVVLEDGTTVDVYEVTDATFPNSAVKYLENFGILITVTTTLDVDEAIAVATSVS
jgi:hypothetical protein